jgi:hypothetical protein
MVRTLLYGLQRVDMEIVLTKSLVATDNREAAAGLATPKDDGHDF